MVSYSVFFSSLLPSNCTVTSSVVEMRCTEPIEDKTFITPWREKFNGTSTRSVQKKKRPLISGIRGVPKLLKK